MAEGLCLSVLIPTYNRRASLERLLESLSLPAGVDGAQVEVLVIDNAGSEETQDFLRHWSAAERRIPVLYLSEGRKGKAHALNTGLRQARGDVILVLDDDVVAGPDCLSQHLEGYRMTKFDALQGKILPGVDAAGVNADLARLREYNIPYIDYGDDIRPIRGLTGTNMSFKREVFEKVGFFDVRLGPGAAGFSEDTEFSMRARKAGFKIGYAPRAIVYHELNPNRYGREYNRMVEYRKGLSRSVYRRDSIAFRVIPDLAANCLRYVLYRMLCRRQKAYKTEGRIMKGWGYLVGKLRGIPSADTHSEV